MRFDFTRSSLSSEKLISSFGYGFRLATTIVSPSVTDFGKVSLHLPTACRLRFVVDLTV